MVTPSEKIALLRRAIDITGHALALSKRARKGATSDVMGNSCSPCANIEACVKRALECELELQATLEKAERLMHTLCTCGRR